jgi:hypothetical protein
VETFAGKVQIASIHKSCNHDIPWKAILLLNCSKDSTILHTYPKEHSSESIPSLLEPGSILRMTTLWRDLPRNASSTVLLIARERHTMILSPLLLLGQDEEVLLKKWSALTTKSQPQSFTNLPPLILHGPKFVSQ